MRVRWVKRKCGRLEGHEEDNEDWLCKRWIEAGYCKEVKNGRGKKVPKPPANRAMSPETPGLTTKNFKESSQKED